MITLLRNAIIHTMNPAQPRAQAAVIQDGRFVFVGTEEGALLWLSGKQHDVLDAEGLPVLPGFNDAHMHYAHTAVSKLRVSLVGTKSRQEAIERMRAGMDKLHEGWLIAEGWNQEQFDDGRLLTRQDLDAVSTEIPVFASRACGHIGAANSRALAIAGLDIEDGLLREDEQDAIWAHIPPIEPEKRLEAMLAAQHGLFEKGITSVQSDDIGGMEHAERKAFLRSLQAASADGRLKVRYSEQALAGSLESQRAFFEERLHLLRSDGFHVSCMKLLTDGSLGARTAWMRKPYADAPETKGISMYDDDTLFALVRDAAEQGVPTAIHAIGDAAMQQTLDAFEREGRGLRNAVVHAQICDAEQTIRAGRLGLTIMAQPIFLDADVPIVRSRVGDTLADTSYRWRTMLGAGAHVALSTDCPVEPYDPMPNLYCAITRGGLQGQSPYLPEEGFSFEEALYAYTVAGAYAEGEEEQKGAIAPGMLADFIVLDRPLDAKEPASLLETGVRTTYIGGECVYRS